MARWIVSAAGIYNECRAAVLAGEKEEK